MSEQIGHLLCVALMAVSPTVNAVSTCASSDRSCFERRHAQSCASETSSVDSCSAWVQVLRPDAANGDDTAAFMLGQAYISLSGMATDIKAAAAYQGQAKEVFKGLVEKQPKNAQALIALAVVSDDRDERIALLRQGVELAPGEIYALQLLASELQQVDTKVNRREAADLLAKAAANQTGRNRWSLASQAYRLFEDVGDEGRAKELRDRVVSEIGARQLREPLPQSQDVIASELKKSCDHYALPVVGAQICMNSVGLVGKAALRQGVTPSAKQLADLAADAMLEASQAPEALSRDAPEWEKQFAVLLRQLIDGGFESASTSLAFARMTSGDVRMRALERTVKFDPTRGDAFLNLGVEYYNRGRWDEAEEMLLKAKQFVPSFNYPMIDSYLKNVSLQRHGETQVR